MAERKIIHLFFLITIFMNGALTPLLPLQKGECEIACVGARGISYFVFKPTTLLMV
jgi:heme/copper-type cytochrome/quinol oxidase subunit 1